MFRRSMHPEISAQGDAEDGSKKAKRNRKAHSVLQSIELPASTRPGEQVTPKKANQSEDGSNHSDILRNELR